MATTSGTVGTYSFTQRRVLDHAFRRAGYTPQQVAGEWLQVAQDLLFLQLSEYCNAGFPLWTREFQLLNVNVGSPDVACPVGTVDVLHTYWRILNPYRGPATLSTGASGAILFGGQPNPDVIIPGGTFAVNDAGYIIVNDQGNPITSDTYPPAVNVNFGSLTEVDTLGILSGNTTAYTTVVYVLVSTDGINYTVGQTIQNVTFNPRQWVYFDLNPSQTTQFIQIAVSLNGGSWCINQVNLGLANGQDIEIGPLNIDDYYNLPDKQFQEDRPNSAYDDRKVSGPVLKIWPTPNLGAFYNGTVSVLMRRYIQDPGALTNNIEVPIRWYEGVVARLGIRLMDELPDPETNAQASYFALMQKSQRRQNLEAAATKAEGLMWSEERVRAPIRWVPNLRPYTS